MSPISVVVVSLVDGRSSRVGFRLMLARLRAFGGSVGQSAVWLFDTGQDAEAVPTPDDAGLQTLPLIVPEAIEGYPFAAKVYACARAEERARGAGAVSPVSLVWIDPCCLIVRPPDLLELGPRFDAALRPVHIKNVGLRVREPVDAYWRSVYETVGVRDLKTTVESFVDRERLRSYFNTHAFAVNGGKGLMREWYEAFLRLAVDEDFQAGPCGDGLHKVFLHQAVLSALLASALEPGRLRILPPEYNYPYHLHGSVPIERRARALNDLVCVAYEDEPPRPGSAAAVGMEIREPLLSWLAEQAGGSG